MDPQYANRLKNMEKIFRDKYQKPSTPEEVEEKKDILWLISELWITHAKLSMSGPTVMDIWANRK